MFAQAVVIALLLEAAAPGAQESQSTGQAINCAHCAEWNTNQAPFRIFGNTYYVGPHGLSSILIASKAGHILIDGDLPQSAAQIEDHIRQLGFRVRDIKLILNSHVHFDHAGGIAKLQQDSGAAVAASPSSARVLEAGASGPDDPQYGSLPNYSPVAHVRRVADGQTLRIGELAVTAHFTPGHTPGGTSWTWKSCESSRCYDIVYADSQSAVSADGFSFTRGKSYPSALVDFRHGLEVIESLPCDILLTPHPEVSDLWNRLDRRNHGETLAMIDPGACKTFAADARRGIAERVTAEEKAPK
jgi:metallo-beta-lactamase class B